MRFTFILFIAFMVAVAGRMRGRRRMEEERNEVFFYLVRRDITLGDCGVGWLRRSSSRGRCEPVTVRD
jgi:hypothetical protein